MGKLEKQIERIMKLDKSLRFDELARILKKFGYTYKQPGRGSSHYTFRKAGKLPTTIVKAYPMDIAYIKKVKDILTEEGF